MSETDISVVDSKDLVTLFGTCDQHVRRIRDALGVSISARNGRIHVEGAEQAVAQATEVLEELQAYARRHGESGGGGRGAGPGRGADSGEAGAAASAAGGVHAGPADPRRARPGRPATWKPSPRTTWCSARGRRARARPTWRWRRRWPRCGPSGSASSCWCARRSRRARASASCPATCGQDQPLPAAADGRPARNDGPRPRSSATPSRT